jgi:hypothetical protein
MAGWHRPIIFEGVELPGVAIAIDHLGLHGNLPEMSEGTGLWLWRFTICVGLRRTDASETILHHAQEALALATQFRDRLLQTVPLHYDGPFEPGVLDAWIAALERIIAIARSRRSCSWEAPLRPGDSGFGRSPEENMKELGERLDKAIKRAKRKAGKRDSP